MATLAVLGLLVAASPAAAIVITGGPTYTPGGSWTCSGAVAGNEKLAGGGNYTCGGTASVISNLYLGINNLTGSPFGNKMNSGGEPSGNELFLWSADVGANSIRYNGQSAMVGYGPLVDVRVTLTFSGAGALVSDATTQSLNGTNIRGNTGVNTNPGVHTLWRIGAGVSSLTVNVLLEASDAGTGAWQPANTYFGTTAAHRRGTGSTELTRSHVDMAFYTSTCGDGQVDNVLGTDGSAEQCDPAGVCCTSACLFASSATQCRGSAGICDVAENCTGSSATCPGDSFVASTTVCRAPRCLRPAENCTAPPPPVRRILSPTRRHSVALGRYQIRRELHRLGTGLPAPRPRARRRCAATRRASATWPRIVRVRARRAQRTASRRPRRSVALGRRLRRGRELHGSSAACQRTACVVLDAVSPSGGVCDVAENCAGSSAACPADGFARRQPSVVARPASATRPRTAPGRA
jgi:hypothetical protein